MVKNMIAHLLTLALGFVAGCTFKDFLGSKTPKSSKRNSFSHIQPPITNNVSNENTVNSSSCFSLQSLKDYFDSYNVSLLNDSSFGILLRKVRSTCYKDILKLFMDKANSPEVLVEMLKTQTVPNKEFSISTSSGVPFISGDMIDAYIVEEGISTSEFSSDTEKVKFLLTLYYGKGINDFKNMLGSNLSDILSAHERGEDIGEIYKDIMYLINSRYGYLS